MALPHSFIKLEPYRYEGARGTSRADSGSQHRRRTTVPPVNPSTERTGNTHNFAAFPGDSRLPVSTAMFDSAWTTQSGPSQHSMYSVAPQQEWSYMDQAAALDTANYMAQPQIYQNPYVQQWSPPHPAYIPHSNVTQPAYSSAPSSVHYPPQLVTTQRVLHNPYQTDHDTSALDTRALQVSPATTSTSMSSTVAGWSATAPPEPTSELPHVCPTRGCGRAYKRKAELDRHTQEKHGPTSGRLLCPVKLCPRGIPGEGFDRMSHLTQHLRSGKHKMSAQQAKFMAREHNPRKGGRGS